MVYTFMRSVKEVFTNNEIQWRSRDVSMEGNEKKNCCKVSRKEFCLTIPI